MRRRLLTLLLALALAGGLGAARPALAHAEGGNSAVAVNQKDDSSLFKFAWAVRHVMSDVVDEQNSSVAYASCNSCQTTAIAIEIVLVEGSPSNESPVNQAVAVNYQCDLCDTFATAYQFVVNTGGPVHFTNDGIQELHDIRKEIASWGKEGLSNEEIRARLPDVIARIKQVLATQLVADGKAQPHEPDETETETTQSTPATTPTGPTATTEGGTVQTTTNPPPDTTETTTGTTTDTTPTTTSTTPTTTTGTTTGTATTP